VPVALIAAVAQNGVIGDHGRIPWRLPSDFAWFKRTTLGKPVIMGRRTFESIGRPLPGRTNLVVSRRPGYQPDGVIVINDLAAALGHAQAIATADRADEVIVAGGAEIYAETMPLADRLYITHVALEPDGDARFPSIDPALWRAVEEPPVPRSERDSADFHIVAYARKAPETLR
jgi:dihydrofolate reductase